MSIQANYLRTATVPLDELTPFPGNAKRGQVGTILESLRRNGQYRGLVVRSVPGGALVVLAGNHTMQALATHGAGDCRKTVPTPDGTAPCGVCRNDPAWLLTARCEIVQCDDATARRINLADNRTSEVGTYDFEALAELLTDLDDLTGTGYSDQDLEDITALISLPQDHVKGQTPAGPAPSGNAAGTGDPGEHDDPDATPDTFLPVITLRVPHAVYDRWRVALDVHPGKDDAAKLLGLLAEVEAARGTA
jgi:hypothetical protein